MKKTVWIMAVLLFVGHVYGDQCSEGEGPLNALFVTGGGWHDFVAQESIITEGLAERIDIEWTVDHEAGERTDFFPTRFEDPDWIEPFDVVIYSKGITRMPREEQEKLTDRIADAHHDTGVPAVLIHNALHFGREVNKWHDFTGVVTRSHGRLRSSEIRNLVSDHFIMADFPEESWTPVTVEAYQVEGVRDNVQVLGEVYGADRDKWHVCYWTHQYGEARIFGTTIGHANETMDTPVYLDTLARGVLWATGKN